MKRKLFLLLASLAMILWGGSSTYAEDHVIDITGFYITNPGFETGNTEGWTYDTSSDHGAKSTTGSYAMSDSEGNYLFNIWWKGNPITQTIESLPAGSYTLSAVVASDGATIYMITGDNSDDYAFVETNTGQAGTGVSLAKDFTLASQTDYKIGIVGGDNGEAGVHKPYRADGYWWYKCDNFKLNLKISDEETIPADIVTKILGAKPTGKMSSVVESELNDAADVFGANPTYANYSAYVEAAEKARTSIASYAAIEAGAISTEVLGLWQKDTPNGAVACNTWSTEGSSDGSGMTTPFIQDWVASGQTLGAGRLFYSLEGIEPGEKYNITALVRVYNEAGGSLDGASFFVGNKSVDVDANGSDCTGRNGKYGVFSIQNVEVGADGKLVFGIEIDNESALNWIAIKNVTIAEYANVKVSSITLNETSLSLTTGDGFALVAAVLPENADDKTLTWTSTNESVATVSNTGVVAALSAGSTIITATANDGSGESASCTVTVSDAVGITFATEITKTGEYLIRNVATGKYLGQGNSYGTQASVNTHGVMVTATKTGDTYKFTGICGSGNGLGENGFVDNGTPVALTVALVAGETDIYTISPAAGKYVSVSAGSTVVSMNGTSATSKLAQWQFINKEDNEKNLALATTETPVDATYMIKCPNFSRNCESSVWTIKSSNYNLSGGADENRCAESWHATFTLKQTITVPNGTYKLRAQAAAGDGGESTVYVSANGETTSFKQINNGENSMTLMSASFTSGRYYTDWIEVTVTNNILTVGANTENTTSWCVWDNFELYMTEYANSTTTATIGSTGWTTFAPAYPVNLSAMSTSEGSVKAYYASAVGGDNVTMTSTASEGVAAGTGLMLKGTAGATITIPVVASGSPIEGNHLVGCTTSTDLDANASYYVLVNNGGTAEFQSLEENGATIPAGKAYLDATTTSPGARLVIVFEDDDPMAINAIEAADVETEGLKDGKYFIEGKIVIVKNAVKYSANGQILK